MNARWTLCHCLENHRVCVFSYSCVAIDDPSRPLRSAPGDGESVRLPMNDRRVRAEYPP